MNKVIGIVGPIGSGKSTVVSILKQKGFCDYSLSDRIRESLRGQDKPETRKNMFEEGNRLRKENGVKVLAERTLDIIRKDNCGKIVVESIRNYHEAKYLKDVLDAVILYVDAPQKIRFQRLNKRDRSGDPDSYAEFQEIDDKELKSQKESTQNIDKTREYADHVIVNDREIVDLKDKVENFLKDVHKNPVN